MGNARDLRRVAACLCLAALLAFAAIPAPAAASDAVPQPLGEALRADALALSPVALDPALDPQPPSTVLGMQWVTGDRLLVGDASYTLCELVVGK